MKLSKNFQLAEFEYSDTAFSENIDNSIPPQYLPSIQNLVNKVLQPLRDEIGPIIITSGFRSDALNDAISGSSKTSQHMVGEAADIISNKLSAREIFNKIKELDLDYDQLIFEKRRDVEWVHVSCKLNSRNRKSAFDIIFI